MDFVGKEDTLRWGEKKTDMVWGGYKVHFPESSRDQGAIQNKFGKAQ